MCCVYDVFPNHIEKSIIKVSKCYIFFVIVQQKGLCNQDAVYNVYFHYHTPITSQVHTFIVYSEYANWDSLHIYIL